MQKKLRLGVGWVLALGLLSRGAAAGIDDLQGTTADEMPQPNNFGTAERCTGCHRAEGQDPLDYMPTDTWAGTMMANAWRDPIFKAALTIANQDVPGIGTFCLRCHSPVGFVNGRATPPDGSGFDPNAASDGKIVDGQGVSCNVCHRAETTLGPDGKPSYHLGNAQLVFDTSPDAAGFISTPVMYGPYENVESNSHVGERDPSLAGSQFCGQCHQVTNPEVMLRNADGTETTIEFPLDTTFEEWAASDFRDGGPDARSCVDCHMRRKTGELAVADLGPLRTDPRDHVLVGGNHWGIQAVMAAEKEYVAEREAAFQLALDRTLESLASAASVTLVEAPEEALPGDEITLTVRVENLTGHKFPTGYAESRRAWIAVFLVDEAGVERPLLGGYDADTGEIQHEPPTHEYRAVHGRWDDGAGVGEKEEHIALHDMVISDTRIPPKGFVPSRTTQPTQEIHFGDGNGGYRNYDEASFTLTVPADASGAQTLSARVYYQSMTREYIEFLRSANVTDNKGEELMAIYEDTGEAPPILVANADAPIDLGDPPDTTGSTGSGGSGGSGGDGAGGSPTGGAASGSREDGGCGLRTPGNGHDGWLPAALAGLALASAAARRRRAHQRR
ncbi:MYXO-CTERM sorting domain-containing protein [Sorangium sp. So ce1099]|uniref:MYXO-CTERM sorting domain-containing protein n=1 Tax=Sorangium sp. So ce1099 TaxID=3133331 RepID=UPI003F5EDAF9